MTVKSKYCADNQLENLKESLLITVGKMLSENGKKKITDMSDKDFFNYIVKFLISEHSIISNIEIRIVDQMDKNIRNQIVRHTKGRPRFYCQSSRPDWNNGQQRDPNQKTFNILDWNAEAFREMTRQRLCYRTEKNTRQWIEKVLNDLFNDGYINDGLQHHDHVLLNAVCFCAVPNCVYRFGCPEVNGCDWFENNFFGKINSRGENIINRYLLYHKMMGRDFSNYLKEEKN